MIYVNFKKLTETAITPTKATKDAAGFDLYADEVISVGILPGRTARIFTGIAVEIPAGYSGFVFSRSGIATNRGLRLPHCVGVIDRDFRGNIGVPLYNDTDVIQMIQPHERVAQLVIIPTPEVELYEVEHLSETERGTGGFGSTGR